MKIVRSIDLKFLPASHEDVNDPGVVKRVLLTKKDLVKGRIEMINWARLPKGKSFQAHYHEDMDEVFIILNGKVEIKVGKEKEVLAKGDAVVIPMKKIHVMTNVCAVDIDYIALGISRELDGKTIVI